MNRIIAIGLLVLSACSTGALEIAPDTYRVSVRVPFSSEAGALDRASEQASDFCRSKGKSVLIVGQRSNKCPLQQVECGNVQVDFKCE